MVDDKTIKARNKMKKTLRSLESSCIFNTITNNKFENPELEQIRADTKKWFQDFEAKYGGPLD
ncbi:MAG: hypothetical protein FWE49_02400 [Synergistaceae bacterium]|nr:hypothetical protein [Synergistaceae bacterium]